MSIFAIEGIFSYLSSRILDALNSTTLFGVPHFCQDGIFFVNLQIHTWKENYDNQIHMKIEYSNQSNTRNNLKIINALLLHLNIYNWWYN